MPEGAEKNVAINTFALHVARWTKHLEAVLAARRAPATIQGMGSVILQSMAGIQDSLTQIVDVLRFQVSTLSF